MPKPFFIGALSFFPLAVKLVFRIRTLQLLNFTYVESNHITH